MLGAAASKRPLFLPVRRCLLPPLTPRALGSEPAAARAAAFVRTRAAAFVRTRAAGFACGYPSSLGIDTACENVRRWLRAEIDRRMRELARSVCSGSHFHANLNNSTKTSTTTTAPPITHVISHPSLELSPVGPAPQREHDSLERLCLNGRLRPAPLVGERGLFAPALLVARPALTGFVPQPSHLIFGTSSYESTRRPPAPCPIHAPNVLARFMRVIGSLWVWAGFFVVVAVTDVALLTATGNGDSGQQDGFGQVFGFLLFLLCGFLVVALSATAGVRTWRRRHIA